MCKTCEQLVYSLRKSFGKFLNVLVEKFNICTLVCKTTAFYTIYNQLFSQANFLQQPLQLSEFSPLSTPLTATTNLNKGVI